MTCERRSLVWPILSCLVVSVVSGLEGIERRTLYLTLVAIVAALVGLFLVILYWIRK